MRGVRDIVDATLRGVPTSAALLQPPRQPPRLLHLILVGVLVATNAASLYLLWRATRAQPRAATTTPQ